MAAARAEDGVGAAAAALEKLNFANGPAQPAPKPGGTKKAGGKKGRNAHKKALKDQMLQQRQELNRLINARLNKARFADEAGTQVRNALDDFPPFCCFDRNDLHLEIRQYARGEGETSAVPAEILDACFAMTEKNMRDLYEQAGWGWNALKKKRELEDKEARLLVAADKMSGSVVGFLHLRFLREDDDLVLYVYELQVEQASASRKGLGRHLMMLAELIARKSEMEWVMLTVLKCNEAANKFYTGLKYTVDELSPQMSVYDGDEEDEVSYVILSKRLPSRK